ncbi:hypothetical protein SASPL_137810 [Salvia splendens]|uniref:EGF-like domain-containing protein n=1 Tax=Salvia splendens TaxID=180675 RepID=A0A8X8WSD3_SALSN|nr:hypothetical protein SASPL_137810 [Salvia splendens]
MEQISVVSKLTKACLNVRGEDRPSTKEVAMELEGLILRGKHSWECINVYYEEKMESLIPIDDAMSRSGVTQVSDMTASPHITIHKPKLDNMQASILVMIIFTLPTLVLSSQNFPLSKENCDDSCGDIRIPFPFGTTKECYLAIQFWVTCNRTTTPPKLFWWNTTIPIIDISLEGQITLLQRIAKDCYHLNASSSLSIDTRIELTTSFTVNYTANRFTIVGCDAYALVSGNRLDRTFMTGCTAMCSSRDDLTEGSCAGVGCCQTPIPQNVTTVGIRVNSYSNYTDVSDFNTCGYAFVVKDSAFNFSKDNLTNLLDVTRLPAVIDWAIGNGTCEQAERNADSYACVSANSQCYKPTNGYGYRCRCKDRFEGNPYLPKGCRDINECLNESLHNCNKHALCTNEIGNYTCTCPDNYDGDGMGVDGCREKPPKDTKITFVLIGKYYWFVL